MMLIMLRGVKDSVNFNNIISLYNCFNIFLIIMVGVYYINTSRFHPFFPNGDPTKMLKSIGLTYFSVIGFDAAALYSKETVNPKKTIPLAIIASILCSGAIYILVAVVAIGLAPLNTLNTNQGLVMAFEYVGKTYFSKLISIGSLIGITTSTFVNLLCQPRVFLSISNDGLMSSKFAKINKIGVPAMSTYLSGLIAIPISFLFDIDILANVISIACLLAYGLVSLSCIKCRYEDAPFSGIRMCFLIVYCIISILLGVASVNNWPMEVIIVSVTLLLGITLFIYLHDQTNMPTKFACPGMPFIPLIAILSIFYIFGTISLFPHILFGIFIVGACIMYFKYSIHHSKLNTIKKD
jgi:basic amino acid/polyamine antiporter, APA family